MSVTRISVERFSIVSSKPFDQILKSLESVLGHPDMKVFMSTVTAANDLPELEKIVHQAIGSSGLMEFVRFNIGQILQKQHGPRSPRILRVVMGNPLIMKEMAVHVHDAASYAPVTVLIDERPDGVHLSYDRMASLIASYGSVEASKVAETLDAKIEKLLESVAQ
ncbi:MAG TPA: DUF302 domain-containing protein [Terriglobales bacterium]|jgi:uncharacterized protein (DUF302 family)|nr:DUF302 domain-containing protein [Terriglobales bacterium]